MEYVQEYRLMKFPNLGFLISISFACAKLNASEDIIHLTFSLALLELKLLKTLLDISLMISSLKKVSVPFEQETFETIPNSLTIHKIIFNKFL